MSNELEVSAIDVGRELAIYADPARMEKVESHIACGGSLIDLCRLQSFSPGTSPAVIEMRAKKMYLDTMKWIKADPARTRAYAAAKEAREEWLFETVLSIFKAISEFDFKDIVDERGAFLPVSEWPKHASICIKSLDIYEHKDSEGNVIGETKRAPPWDKNKTLEAIGKHLREFHKSADSGSDSWAKMVEDSFGLPDEDPPPEAA